MGDDEQVMDEDPGMPDQMGGSLEALLGPSLGFEPEPEEAASDETQDMGDLVPVKLNGKDLQVPKEVASALAQGRRFQGDKDRLEETNRRYQQDIGDLRQQMQQMQQMFLQQQQTQTKQPQGPSPIQLAFARADEAVAAGSGVLSALGPVLEQYMDANNRQVAAKLDQILQASQQQQVRLQEIDQQTHVTSLQQQIVDGVKFRQQEDGVELTPEQQQTIVGRVLSMQEASGYDRNAIQGQFLAAYYQTAFEAAKQPQQKSAAPSMIFNRRPPVGAPILPRNAGVGAASPKRDANLRSTVELIQG